MKKLETLGFKHFCMSVGNLPSSYVESLSYYECLLWLIKYLQEEVIPTVNNNSEVVEELQGLYLELKSYVDNYFDNLDVQEEINNKLDEMVEQGTLQEIIADYLNSKAIFGFDNVYDMKNSTNLINGSYAKTLGYHTKNDGGSGLYKIRNINNDDIIDNGLIIEMSDDNLVAELIVENDYITPNQFGAIGDGINDDTEYIQKAIDSGYNVKFVTPLGATHLVFDNKRYTVDGNNKQLHYIGNSAYDEFILFTGVYSNFKNLIIVNDTDETIKAIKWYSVTGKPSQFNYFENIDIRNFELAILYGKSEDPIDTINIEQSENYINNLKLRGIHRGILNNQPNGHLFIDNSVLYINKNESTYNYTESTSCISNSHNGVLHIYNSNILNTSYSTGYGLIGHEYDINNCSIEVAGYPIVLDGYTKINNTWNGYKSNNLPFISINDGLNPYNVFLNGIDLSATSNTNKVPFIKNNSNYINNVYIDNCKLKGNLYARDNSISQCFGNITNSVIFNNNDYTYLNYNLYNINYINYSKYLIIDAGTSVTTTNNKINLTRDNGNLKATITVEFIDIFDFIALFSEISGTLKANFTIYYYDGTSVTASSNLTNGMFTSSLKYNNAYKVKIEIFSQGVGNISIDKLQIRGNNIKIVE